jgi:hypothetical protein
LRVKMEMPVGVAERYVGVLGQDVVGKGKLQVQVHEALAKPLITRMMREARKQVVADSFSPQPGVWLVDQSGVRSSRY